MSPSTPALHRWIKTDCGRAKLAELQQRTGPANRVRLAWFILTSCRGTFTSVLTVGLTVVMAATLMSLIYSVQGLPEGPRC